MTGTSMGSCVAQPHRLDYRPKVVSRPRSAHRDEPRIDYVSVTRNLLALASVDNSQVGEARRTEW